MTLEEIDKRMAERFSDEAMEKVKESDAKKEAERRKLEAEVEAKNESEDAKLIMLARDAILSQADDYKYLVESGKSKSQNQAKEWYRKAILLTELADRLYTFSARLNKSAGQSGLLDELSAKTQDAGGYPELEKSKVEPKKIEE